MLDMCKLPISFQLKQKMAFFSTGHNSAFSCHRFMLIYQQMTEQGNLTLEMDSHKPATHTKNFYKTVCAELNTSKFSNCQLQYIK